MKCGNQGGYPEEVGEVVRAYGDDGAMSQNPRIPMGAMDATRYGKACGTRRDRFDEMVKLLRKLL